MNFLNNEVLLKMDRYFEILDVEKNRLKLLKKDNSYFYFFFNEEKIIEELKNRKEKGWKTLGLVKFQSKDGKLLFKEVLL